MPFDLDREKFKQERQALQRELRERTVGYLTAALGLVAGLAWNEAVKALIETVVPEGKNSLLAKFIYAGGVTLIVVVITIYLVRWAKKDETPK